MKLGHSSMRFRLRCWTVGAPVLLLAGCHASPYIQASVTNLGSDPVQLVEIDYPNASFGVQQIAPQAQFHYRFKLQGSGPISITFVGSGHKTYTVQGPQMHEGEQGSLTIDLRSDGTVRWSTPPRG